MKTGYTPEQGRGFARPGETGKQQNCGFSGIKKAAPKWSRLSEQLTCCEKNGSVQGNYINRVTKRHNCRITGKTKATTKGRQWVLRQIKLERITNNATFAADGQCAQCAGLLVGYQLFDSMPRLSNSRRKSLLIHPDRLSSPSSFMAILKRSNKSASRRSCTENLSFLLSLVDMVNLCGDNAIKVTMYTNDTTKTTPRSGGTHAGRLTTNDNDSIEVAMRNHTTHPQGRDSHNLNKYIWRFIALSTTQPRVIHIVATNEQEARQKNQLIAIASQGYDLSAPAKSGAGIGVLVFNEAHNTRPACFFVPDSHTLSMVGCMGAEQSAPGSSLTGYANPVQSTASEIGVSCGGFINPNEEAANMATIPTPVHSQTAFIWRFIIFGASESQIIHVTAWTEREARNRCPSGCVAVFAARIRQEVAHV